jgi:trans-AT polyketide synthase/acyltransferase/oxidoreductase domain-containing protein
MDVSTPQLDHPRLSETPPTAGYWTGDRERVTFEPLTAGDVLGCVRSPTSVVYDPAARRVGYALGGTISSHRPGAGEAAYPLLAMLPPLYPEWLGDRAFTEAHGLRFAYMGGSMARGIATTELVIALAEVGALGMFGAAGLPVAEVRAAIGRMRAALEPRELPWGCNLIHSLNEPALEEELVDLYLAEGVYHVEASAFMRLTPAVVRYACSGLSRGPDGQIMRERHLFAKISREEVARHFLSPAPEAMLARLVAEGKLTAEEGELAARVPLAEQLIVEGDSGGHTDNRVLGAVLPAIARIRDELAERFGYACPVHLGAAGGLGTPEAVAAAFALGAAFVVVGSVHQAALESGVSDDSRDLLGQASPTDVAMTASADMFEMGVKVQVLTRGTLMATRGNQLFEVYRRHGSIEEISPEIRAGLEKNVFRMPLEEVWERTRAFFQATDGRQVERAERDPKHRLALVCRWYLGSSSRWPIDGKTDRRGDYQLWCGPAMGAFNRWTAGTFLESAGSRAVQQIALNLMEGAAAVTRAHQLRSYGLPVAPQAFRYQPTPLRLQ